MESSPIFQGKLLLQLLIVDNHKTLLQAIISLDPFPNDDCFKQLSTIVLGVLILSVSMIYILELIFLDFHFIMNVEPLGNEEWTQ
jgi:hypothetical protein